MYYINVAFFCFHKLLTNHKIHLKNTEDTDFK